MSGQTPLESIIGWIRSGYPQGIDPSEFPPLLALLTRVLDDDQVTAIALHLVREYGSDGAVTEEQIHDAITAVTEQSPTPEEINQVASRLAAAGWPLAPAVPVG